MVGVLKFGVYIVSIRHYESLKFIKAGKNKNLAVSEEVFVLYGGADETWTRGLQRDKLMC